MPRLSIIVPTCREAENLPELIHRISSALRKESYDFEVIIVDDNSPDETVAVCQQLQEIYPVRLHVRTDERGLSSAVIAGMTIASGDLLICMDADLSHPPESIPELVANLENRRTDFVIGSRYVPGGSTEGGWGILRWMNSRVATLLARPLTTTSDPMAGFFGLRRETFVAATELNPVGYKIGLELMVKCGCRQVVEVPIRFAKRLHGSSKLTLREQLNYLLHLRRLYRFRFGVWARCVEFLLIGMSGAFVDLIVLSCLLSMMIFEMARPVAILAAMSWNFAMNRSFTFVDATRDSALVQYAGFVSACSLGAVINWATSVTLFHTVGLLGGKPLIAAAVGVFVGAFFNFVLCSRLVFRTRKQTGPSGGKHTVAECLPA